MATTEALPIELRNLGSSAIIEHHHPVELSAHPSEGERQREEDAVALQPVDGGFHAWLFVFSAFVLECLVWGFPFRSVASVVIGER